MALFLIQSEGCPQYVEAESYPEALGIYKMWAIDTWKLGPDEWRDDDLRSITRIHDEPVLRAHP
jgi:hypothetical protein